MMALELADAVVTFGALRAVPVAAAFGAVAAVPVIIVGAVVIVAMVDAAADQTVAAVELRAAALGDRHHAAGLPELGAGRLAVAAEPFGEATELTEATVMVVATFVVGDAGTAAAVVALVATPVVAALSAEHTGGMLVMVLAADQAVAAVELQLTGDRGLIDDQAAVVTELPAAVPLVDANTAAALLVESTPKALALVANATLTGAILVAAAIFGAGDCLIVGRSGDAANLVDRTDPLAGVPIAELALAAVTEARSSVTGLAGAAVIDAGALVACFAVAAILIAAAVTGRDADIVAALLVLVVTAVTATSERLFHWAATTVRIARSVTAAIDSAAILRVQAAVVSGSAHKARARFAALVIFTPEALTGTTAGGAAALLVRRIRAAFPG
jgi:hypothetical protein